MKIGRSTHILVVLAAAVFLFGLGFKLGQYNARGQGPAKTSYNFLNILPPASFQEAKNIDFALFWDVWSKLQDKYVDRSKLDGQKMFYGALKGLASSLGDSYTFFLTPEENKQSKDDLGGKFEGIGAQLGLKDTQIVIIAPLKNSPAEKAGIRAGDAILEVDDQSTKGWTLPEAVSKIRGEKGTKVKLTLARGERTFELTLTRDEIIVSSVEFSYEKEVDCKTNCSQVAYLKVNQFGENTNDEWDRAVNEVADKWAQRSIKGIIIDMRDNPGGFLESSVYLAEEFLTFGKMVVKQESTVGESKEYYVGRGGKLLDIPAVVLINKGSASASEIFAGALRDYKRATLIGEKSFGKGSVQEALDLKNGAGLHITVAKWILPNGDWINEKGVEPNVVVENKADEKNTLTRQTDLQLEKAVEQLVK